MIEFLNWWVETWPRAIVAFVMLFGIGGIIYDIGITFASRKSK